MKNHLISQYIYTGINKTHFKTFCGLKRHYLSQSIFSNNLNKQCITCIKQKMETKIQRIKNRIQKIENELENNRTSSFQDGWQSSKHIKKGRKWDILAKEKMNLISQLDNLGAL